MNDNINWLFEILKLIIPAILSCMATLFITNYSFRKNRPLENYKIAYNRVYYPIYRIIKETNTYMEIKIEKINSYINKYEKYVDRSTIKSFNNLRRMPNKASYQNFCDNIDKLCSVLRVNLGYLEPSFFRMYKYSPTEDKRFFRMMMEGIFVLLAFTYRQLWKSVLIQQILYCIMIILGTIFFMEVIIVLAHVIKKWFVKIFMFLRYKILK